METTARRIRDLPEVAKWPVTTVSLPKSKLNVIVRSQPLAEDKPTVLFLPDVAISAELCFEKYINDPVIEPLLAQFNLVLLNYPGMAAKETGENQNMDPQKIPSFTNLCAVVQEYCDVALLNGCIGFGIGMGATILMNLETLNNGSFAGLVLVAASPAGETGETVQELRAGYADKEFDQVYVQRWVERRWLAETKTHVLSSAHRSTYMRQFSSFRPPALTYAALHSYLSRPSIDHSIDCPVLYIHPLDADDCYVYPLWDAAELRDAMLVGVRGGVLCLDFNANETAFGLSALLQAVYDDFNCTALNEVLLPRTEQAVNRVFRTATGSLMSVRLRSYLDHVYKAHELAGSDIAKAEFRLNLVESDWEGARAILDESIGGWWTDSATHEG
ncbi:hypothetical protein J8273_8756 [Carpediemonas membranifera]|uniref:Uncharacterized protein n=1 Tax=Carpediemonas membranifera TaxID=201153 RepID=A0A8J6AX48_9EUKA|nr:hypothetical protein J8273_8756 [Carpediemonas membranifera]|eukprot:KAG9389464.1 hypothetical protein J8273_8756 [Carpediemonas membranifera]